MKRHSMESSKSGRLGRVQASVRRVAWLGPNSQGLGWLQEQVRGFQSTRSAGIELVETSGLSLTELQLACEAGVERLVLSCVHRFDYPRAEIEWLGSNWPEVPIALATDSWWDGARRTGMGELRHLSMPWHRWWDGWTDWLDGLSPELMGPCVLSPTYGIHETQFCPVGSESVGRVIANCWQTAEAWRLAGEQVGATVEWQTADDFQASIRMGFAAPLRLDWLLWDDSCLTTAGGDTEEKQCLNFVELAKQRFSKTPLWCAFSMPRWSLWEKCEAAGAVALLTKPSTGRGLQRLLGSTANRQSSRAMQGDGPSI